MKKGSQVIAAAIATVLLVCPRPAEAHRLDEYLQAARFSIQRDGVELEIDLTPGIRVAPAVYSLIDTNGDGLISNAEAREYAEQVLKTIDLYIDQAPIALTLKSETFPELSAMNAGTGIIRLRANGKYAPLPAGSRELFYRNRHQPNISVYLANALVPEDKQIEITAQRRDTVQQELAIDFRVIPASRWSSQAWLIIALVAVGVLVAVGLMLSASLPVRAPRDAASPGPLLRQAP